MMDRVLSISMAALLLAVIAFAALETWVEIHAHFAQEYVQAGDEVNPEIRSSPR